MLIRTEGLSDERIAQLLAVLRGRLAGAHGRVRRSSKQEEGPKLLDWATQYLPQHFALPPSQMHGWLAEKLQELRFVRGAKINILAPRGSAKSTIASLAYPLLCALEGWEPYIWIISDTRRQAYAHLENIKLELEQNPQIRLGYPDVAGQGPVWRSNYIVLRNGCAIEAFGTGQRLRGRRRRQHRPTLIICDDLENDRDVLSPQSREKVWRWFHAALMKAGSPQTNVIHLATALHKECLAMKLTQTPGWITRVFRAIERWPENMDLWRKWEEIYTDSTNADATRRAKKFYDAHRGEMEKGAVCLWPEKENLYQLMCMRAEGGHAAFEREKQNCPLDPENFEWPEEYFEGDIWFNCWPEHPRVKTLALDPSLGNESRRGDYSAYVMLAVDRRGLLYVQADLARRSAMKMVADGIKHLRQFQPDGFAVEANQFQQLFAELFAGELRREGMLEVRPFLLRNYAAKQVRIRRLGPYLAQRRLRFKRGCPSTQLLVEQLRQFPTADHDDGPDALEMALRLAAQLLGARGGEKTLGRIGGD